MPSFVSHFLRYPKLGNYNFSERESSSIKLQARGPFAGVAMAVAALGSGLMGQAARTGAPRHDRLIERCQPWAWTTMLLVKAAKIAHVGNFDFFFYPMYQKNVRFMSFKSRGWQNLINIWVGLFNLPLLLRKKRVSIIFLNPLPHPPTPNHGTMPMA